MDLHQEVEMDIHYSMVIESTIVLKVKDLLVYTLSHDMHLCLYPSLFPHL